MTANPNGSVPSGSDPGAGPRVRLPWEKAPAGEPAAAAQPAPG